MADPEGLIPGWTSYRVHFTTSLGPKHCIGASNKPTLIDLEAEMANRAQAETQRERLSERAPEKGDAIVRSHGNNNHESHTEMI